ncbi:MAG: ribonuclease HII [Gammaproteobacteria bacterium]|nr:ribonuclease HII [Gammaproteobacteria bacterium]
MKHELIVGIDEAGRGPLAGPVVAAAVILDPDSLIEGLNDSKKLTERKREALYDLITANALSFAIASASVAEIDDINILQATLLAMQRAVAKLNIKPTFAQIDGNICPKLDIPSEAIIKGDQLIPSISAASILAKVYRDRQMLALDLEYPQYGFAKHKGYGTKQHIDAIKQHSITPHHRRSFAPIKNLISSKSMI